MLNHPFRPVRLAARGGSGGSLCVTSPHRAETVALWEPKISDSATLSGPEPKKVWYCRCFFGSGPKKCCTVVAFLVPGQKSDVLSAVFKNSRPPEELEI